MSTIPNSTFHRRSTDADTVGLVSPAKTKSNPLGAGRNPRAGEAATIRIALRLTPKEHAAYLAAAKDAGMSIGEWLRAAAEARLPKRRKA